LPKLTSFLVFYLLIYNFSLISTFILLFTINICLNRVLSRLQLWGIGPRLYNLVEAFMTNSIFKVRFNDKTSSSPNLLNGIPQGSPLSVVLFIIAFDHVNLRLARYKKISLSLYADDIIIFTKEKNLRTVKKYIFKNSPGRRVLGNILRRFSCHRKMPHTSHLSQSPLLLPNFGV